MNERAVARPGRIAPGLESRKKSVPLLPVFLALYWNGRIAEAKKRAHHASGGGVI
jgi:hypothetical protein